MNPEREQQNPFISYLEDLVRRQDRPAMAALQRGLGKPPGQALDMCRYVVPFLAVAVSRWREEVYYLVAALFAYWHQGRDGLVTSPPINLGASWAQMVTTDNEDSLDRRFAALLKSHPDDLPVHLRQAVGLLKSNDIAVNWQQLLKDLLNWDHQDQFVQRNWARSFWGRRTEAETLPLET
jgi:CRISPR system Cascade subunit CasB